jgi:hypothetical protein
VTKRLPFLKPLVLALVGLSMFLTAANAKTAAPSSCTEVLSKSKDRGKSARLARQIIELGYPKEVAVRIVKRNPLLAEKLASGALGKPLTIEGINPATRIPQRVYRGMQTHPYDFDPRLPATKDFSEFWFGNLVTASGYSYDSELAAKRPASGRKKNLTMIIEMVMPSQIAKHVDRNSGYYVRGDLPDDTLFITRIAVHDYSQVTRSWIPGTMDDYNIEPKTTYYSYEELFDEFGTVKPRSDW